MQLDPWQIEVAKYRGDLLLCTGRRVGKTYILSRKAIDFMAEKKNTPIVIVSLTEDQAMIIMSMALNYAKEKYPKLIGKGRNKPTMKSLCLNGGRMIVRPVGNSGDGARGFEGGVLIVDEASRMPKMFWIAAKPILLTTNGQIWMGSTPFGMEGYFWDRYNDAVNLKIPNARFKVFSISTEEAMNNRPISSSWTEEQKNGSLRILAEDKREMTSREYMQEYLGMFVNEILSYFTEEMIQKICVLKRQPIQHELRHYLGIDVGGLGADKSSFEIIKKISNDRLEQVENLTTKRTYLTETTAKIIELQNLWDFKQIGIDNQGIGAGPFHFLLNDLATRRKIVGLNNSEKPLDKDGKKHTTLLKEDMYEITKAMMEQNRLFLLDDDSVKSSLRSIQQELIVSETGRSVLRIHGRDSHIAEGIIRATYLAVLDKQGNLWVR